MANKKRKLTPQQRQKIQEELLRKEQEAQRRKNTTLIVSICICVAVVIILVIGLWPRQEGADPNTQYIATIDIKDYGIIKVELDPKNAPITVDNFVKLAERGFYNGLTFHRIIEGFMMQGGAPASEADEADTIVGEFTANGYDNQLKHTRGVISMARTTVYNSASSQFFIVHEDSSHLDGQYAAFGKVIEGIEVVDKICETAEPTDNNGSIAKADQPVINTITIEKKEA